LSAQPFVKRNETRLFLTSFTILFFELICIRWIPAYVRYVGYFSNFILLASFLGVGLGVLMGRRSWKFPPFAFLLIALVIVVRINRLELKLHSTAVLYYGAGEGPARKEHYAVLPLVITLIVLAFIPLARPLGGLLSSMPRLRAYAIDIAGSLAGIAAFFVMALLSLPPLAWFLVLSALVASLAGPRSLTIAAVPLVAVLAIVFGMQRDTKWSPYYKITVLPADGGGVAINVNNVGHQIATSYQNKESFYSRIYDLFPGESFERVLILGSGSGSDTSIALANGVGSIDAVEIDPTILKLGKQLHPDHPYDDPRVETHLGDGRAYLRNTDSKYDLIIFALPDSLTLTSGFSNLRLESFLLTQDALEDARDQLSDRGMVVLYNYYREDWFIEKLAGMLDDVFDTAPFVSSYGGSGRAAVLMGGPRLADLAPEVAQPYAELAVRDPAQPDVLGEGFFAASTPHPATDDWPFLYLRKPGFPSIYASSLLFLFGLALAGVLIALPRRSLRAFDWHMFLLGAAFILLETKSIVTFGLLFGATWMVNSLVFFAILASVLLAIVVSARVQIRNPRYLYGALALTLVANYVIRPEQLLIGVPIVRYLVTATIAFTPVFLANIVFARSFRDSETADLAFASNLIGIMVGGTMEYVALMWGYRSLLLIAMVLYLSAAVLQRRGVGLAPAA
jgi:hypothetical protein